MSDERTFMEAVIALADKQGFVTLEQLFMLKEAVASVAIEREVTDER